jgi:hypothetical protein
MPHLVLGKILERIPNAKKDGAAWLLPDDIEATLFVALGEEVLQVAKIARIDIGTEVLEISTHKQERFFFPPEQIVGFRVGGESKALRGSAGFR